MTIIMDDEINESADTVLVKESGKPARLSLHMIVRRHLPPEAQRWSHEKILGALDQISHLRLDRENIGSIDCLELLGPRVTNVYLQQNQIKCIENLDSLTSLQFLTLAGNKIEKVENLHPLSKLLFLDLSGNQIANFNLEEFPKSLIILNLNGNTCTHLLNYREQVIQGLPKLQQLDNVVTTQHKKPESGLKDDLSEDDDKDKDETEEATAKWRLKEESSKLKSNGSLPEAEASLRGLAKAMLKRCQERKVENLERHRLRTEYLENLRQLNIAASAVLSARPACEKR